MQLALTLSLSVAIPFGAATVLYLAMLLTVMVARELRGYTRKRAYIPFRKEKGEESWVWYVVCVRERRTSSLQGLGTEVGLCCQS